MKITKTHIRYLLILAQVLIWIGIIWAMTKNQQIAENMLVGFESPPAIYVLWICFPFMLLMQKYDSKYLDDIKKTFPEDEESNKQRVIQYTDEIVADVRSKN